MNTANTTTTRRRIDSWMASRASAQTRRGERCTRSSTASRNTAPVIRVAGPGPCRTAATSQPTTVTPTATHATTSSQFSKAPAAAKSRNGTTSFGSTTMRRQGLGIRDE